MTGEAQAHARADTRQREMILLLKQGIIDREITAINKGVDTPVIDPSCR